MKKVFLILILNAYFVANAQQNPYPPGSYNAKPALDKFVGTWQWVSGNDTVVLHLYKQAIHYPAPLNYDVENIIGWHKYVKNGVTIESSLQYSGSPYTGGHSTIFAWCQSAVKLYGSFDDLSKNKQCDLYLKMLNTRYSQMEWKIMESRGIRPTGFQYGFTLPVMITLTKQ